MGYYNPIYVYGVEAFLAEAKAAGVDGLIVVDLPPEEDEELCLPALAAGLNFIRLATPTTDDERLPAVLANTSGFVYYVSITGITGAAAPNYGASAPPLRASSAIPICRSRSASACGTRRARPAIAAHADGVVVGTALVEALRTGARPDGRDAAHDRAVAELVCELAWPQGVRRPPARPRQSEILHELDVERRSAEDPLAACGATRRKTSGSNAPRAASSCSTRISKPI